MNPKQWLPLVVLIVSTTLFVAAIMLVGCGSGVKTPIAPTTRNTASAEIHVTWPSSSNKQTESKTRFIHEIANTVRIVVRSGSTEIATAWVARPDTVVKFASLPLYDLTFEAQAYVADPPGTPPGPNDVLSRATLTPEHPLEPGITNQLSFTLITETDTVAITPVPAIVAPGGTLQMSANSMKGTAVILGGFGAYDWSSDNVSVASIDPQKGIILGVAPGTATITAKERGSDDQGKSGTLQVTVSTPGGGNTDGGPEYHYNVWRGGNEATNIATAWAAQSFIATYDTVSRVSFNAGGTAGGQRAGAATVHIYDDVAMLPANLVDKVFVTPTQEYGETVAVFPNPVHVTVNKKYWLQIHTGEDNKQLELYSSTNGGDYANGVTYWHDFGGSTITRTDLDLNLRIQR